MERTRAFLRDELGLPGGDAYHLPTSDKRFADGGQYRVEIPSVEGPAALRAVLDEAAARDVAVHRVSQGSGVMLQTDAEIRDMVALAAAHDVELCLFTGPRAGWDTGVQAVSASGRVLGASLRGAEQLVYGIEDVRHAVELGVRSVLVADIGQLMVLGRMKARSWLPGDLVLKAIAAIRQAVDVPLDAYVEGPDDFGAPVRHYEIPELVRIGAPIYVKFTVRNAPGTYPSGQHLEATVVALSRERVRRAQIGLAILHRYCSDAIASPRP